VSVRLVIIGLMFTTAMVLGLVAYQIGHRPAGGPAPVAQAPVTAPLTVSYLIAARPVPAGTLTRFEDFNPKTGPSTEVPPGAIIDTPETRAAIRGSLVRHYVEPGAPLMQADLMRPRDRGFLAAVLAPGMRAVSIGVDPVTGVAGLIWPGDRVDVILTQDMGQSGGRAMRLVTSETVLANVQVIAVDQDIAQGTPVNGTSAGRIAGTVTIEATSGEAEKLAVATQLGHLSLAVRSIDDLRPSGSDVGASVTGADVSPELARASAAAIGTRVQVIQGGERGEVTFR
jgi:pilus assembly protein CpaB